MIHPTAIIHPKAELDPTVEVGPYAVIDAGVRLGAHCVLGPHVYITGETAAGSHNVFHKGSVIGDAPQDLKYRGEPTGVRIGDHNVFREHVTVHRSSVIGQWTVIGSHTLFMACAHVGHNSRVGDHAILANGVLLGGYVDVGERAFLSGNVLVHQFTRVGMLAMMQGGSAASKDVPPFTITYEENCLCGLNIVGLRRAGFPTEQRLELKRAYASVFRSRLGIREAAARADKLFTAGPARTLLDFIMSSKRGVVAERKSARASLDVANEP